MSAEARRPDTAFWVEPGAVDGVGGTLDPAESHHLLGVHRAARGASFEAIDGAGTLYRCTLESENGKRAVGRVLERVLEAGELRARIHLLVGLGTIGSVEAI